MPIFFFFCWCSVRVHKMGHISFHWDSKDIIQMLRVVFTEWHLVQFYLHRLVRICNLCLLVHHICSVLCLLFSHLIKLSDLAKDTDTCSRALFADRAKDNLPLTWGDLLVLALAAIQILHQHITDREVRSLPHPVSLFPPTTSDL